MIFQTQKPLLFSSVVLSIFVILSSCAKSEQQAHNNYAAFAKNLNIAETPECKSNCVKLKKEFRYLVKVGEEIYSYWDEKQALYNVDFKAKAIEFENLITDNTSPTQYFFLLDRWAALFRDGHVNAMLKDDLSEIEFYDLAVRLELLAPATDHEKLVIRSVGSNGKVTKLKVGTVVTKIQGQSWKTLLDKAEEFSTGSTSHMRRRRAANYLFRVLLDSEGPKPVLIEGEFNGKPVSETIAREISLYDGSVEKDSESETGIDLITSSILEGNIGYLRIDGFSGSKMPELLSQAMQRLTKTEALIIDVRRNGGGDLSGNAVLAHLTKEPIVRFHQRVNYSEMLQAFRPNIIIGFTHNQGRFSETKAVEVKPQIPNYSNPVFVLTSYTCFSDCDTFVSAIQQNKLATIIGEPTSGGTGNPEVITLPYSQHLFRYSATQGFTAIDKGYIEGNGTIPDFGIEATVEDRVEGKDLQLEKALNFVAKRIQKSDSKASSLALSLPSQLRNITQKDIRLPWIVEEDRITRKSRD